MAMAPHLLNGIVYCLGNGLFFARQEDIDKPRVFWYSIKRPLGPCWCGAMAAQLICNQWVAGSTPVTSSIKKSLDSLKSRLFSFAVTHYLTHIALSGASSGIVRAARAVLL